MSLLPLSVALIAGLPHGAVDHVLLARRIGGWLGIGVGTLCYALLAIGVFVAAGLFPGIVWPAFLLISAWHFGTADRVSLSAGRRRPSRLHGAAAGLIPIAGLMVFGASELRPLAAELSPDLVFLLQPPVVATVGWSTTVVLAAAVVVESMARRYHAVVDLLLVGALFVVAPPVWAFAVYFGLWHAPRHIARMLTEEPPYRIVWLEHGAAASFRRFVRDAIPPTLIAVGALGLALRVAPSWSPVDLAALALQVTAAVTFPHVLAVSYLDHRQAGGR
ncbi:Brp/Blh family beta-carotene 15,15'-dioxygenase [Euzebya tangerina]|uniref:Brp/Blh family beta-carotene 15,15'-dioxygenase n=1 Tax=Euzebya tangerina TaxID=591198 RepID=UPI0013C32A87|nr:Brp/Blh family beta-carotene 15,15'-dioxygenase [Euzebya tangerina]